MDIQTVFEALADSNRRAILKLLKKKELSVGEIAEHFEISGASMSHHLTKLKSAGLVATRREGQSIYYSIQTAVFEAAGVSVIDLFNQGTRNEKRKSK
jgi:ArsR family transcriptional regulator